MASETPSRQETKARVGAVAHAGSHSEILPVQEMKGRRVTIDLTPAAASELDRLRNLTGQTTADVFRYALSLFRIYVDAKQRGHELEIVDAAAAASRPAGGSGHAANWKEPIAPLGNAVPRPVFTGKPRPCRAQRIPSGPQDAGPRPGAAKARVSRRQWPAQVDLPYNPSRAPSPNGSFGGRGGEAGERAGSAGPSPNGVNGCAAKG